MTSMLLLFLCGAVLLVVLAGGGILLLIKMGVILHEAQKPALTDTSEFRLDQGREVRPEHERD